MNSVNLIGRITRDPELRTSSNGKSFVAFTLAISEYSGGNQYTQFVPCFVWDKAAENLAKYVQKGGQLGVSGSINVRQTNNNGQTQSVVTVSVQRVEFLTNNTKNSASGSQNNGTYEFDAPQPSSNDDIEIDNDAILFED